MPVTVVPTSLATVAIETFITELSSVIRNWPEASVRRTMPEALAARSAVFVQAFIRIGLVPDLPDSKIVQAGNAAIEGASIALLSMTKRRELEALVRRAEHCRLETHPSFFDFFVEGCHFKPLETLEQVAR